MSNGIFPTRLVPPADTEVEKNVHGSSPMYENSAYGAPWVWVLTLATCVKISVNAIIIASGVITAHAIPSEACL